MWGKPFFLSSPSMKQVLLVLGGLFVICICTVISINLNLGSVDIPITGQSFAITLVGYVLYHRLGTLAVIFYLVLGCFGLPIFADGGSGIDSLMGKSGGYLYGFVPAAFFCGYLHTKGWVSFPKIVLTMIIGTIIILAIGTSHLAYQIGIEKALKYGLYPFILGACIKILLASVLALLIKKLDLVTIAK